MSSSRTPEPVRIREVLGFLALAFGISWAGALLLLLLLGPVGIAGIGAGLLATTARVVHDRYVAADSLTSGAPLSR